MNCQQCKEKMEAYSEGNLTAGENELFEQHLKDCKSCRKSYQKLYNQTFQRIITDLLKQISLKSWLIIAVMVSFAVAITFVTGGFNKLTSWWDSVAVGEQESMEEINKFGVGNNLGISSESDGIKITITHVLADDIQTHIFYEVEDLLEDRILRLGYNEDSIEVTNARDVFNSTNRLGRQINSIDDVKLVNENVYRGRITVAPIEEEKAEVEVRITSLLEVIESEVGSTTNPTMASMVPSDMENPKLIDGEWTFTIPIQKEELVEKEINVESSIDDTPVRLKTLVIAPTVTFLEYQTKSDPQYQMKDIAFDQLTSKDSIYKREPMSLFPEGRHYQGPQEDNWISRYMPFETMYYDPKQQLDIRVGQINEYIEVNEEFLIDSEIEEPQVFSINDQELIIDNIDVGLKTTMTIKLPDQRKFGYMNFEVISEPQQSGIVNMQTEGLYVDADGMEYSREDLDQHTMGFDNRIRFIPTEYHITLESHTEELVEPLKLMVRSYQITSFPNKQIHIDL